MFWPFVDYIMLKCQALPTFSNYTSNEVLGYVHHNALIFPHNVCVSILYFTGPLQLTAVAMSFCVDTGNCLTCKFTICSHYIDHTLHIAAFKVCEFLLPC